MINYDEMSDLQITEKLCTAMGFEVVTKTKALGVLVTCQAEDGCDDDQWMNHCNSWADIGPLIEKYQVDIRYEGGFKFVWEASHCKHLDDYDVDLIGLNEHKNPKRAAAICIIKLLESKS